MNAKVNLAFILSPQAGPAVGHGRVFPTATKRSAIEGATHVERPFLILVNTSGKLPVSPYYQGIQIFLPFALGPFASFLRVTNSAQRFLAFTILRIGGRLVLGAVLFQGSAVSSDSELLFYQSVIGPVEMVSTSVRSPEVNELARLLVSVKSEEKQGQLLTGEAVMDLTLLAALKDLATPFFRRVSLLRRRGLPLLFESPRESEIGAPWLQPYDPGNAYVRQMNRSAKSLEYREELAIYQEIGDNESGTSVPGDRHCHDAQRRYVGIESLEKSLALSQRSARGVSPLEPLTVLG
jgi:hypothetical protein